MAITDSHTVLVLGAGVSAPFGLSLGGDLISTVSSAIKNEINTISDDSPFGADKFRQNLNSASTSASGFKKFPIHGAVARMFGELSAPDYDLNGLHEELDKIRNLERLLEGQTSQTIDDFIVENPSYAFLTKICIASLFIKSCYQFEGRSAKNRSFSDRYIQDSSGEFSRNWVHLLINIVRQGIRSGSVSADNKVKIVTFNYDKILEYVLEEQFSNTEASYLHYTDFIEIMHMHGECGDLKPLSDSFAETCLQWAKGIHVVNEENVPEGVEKNRKAAQKAIRSAKELYFCGFSFSGPNCRLLGLHFLKSESPQMLISYCNYDGNVGISKTVEKYKSKRTRRVTVEETAGSRDKVLGVSDWLMQGHLGELPG